MWKNIEIIAAYDLFLILFLMPLFLKRQFWILCPVLELKIEAENYYLYGFWNAGVLFRHDEKILKTKKFAWKKLQWFVEKGN